MQMYMYYTDGPRGTVASETTTLSSDSSDHKLPVIKRTCYHRYIGTG